MGGRGKRPSDFGSDPKKVISSRFARVCLPLPWKMMKWSFLGSDLPGNKNCHQLMQFFMNAEASPASLQWSLVPQLFFAPSQERILGGREPPRFWTKFFDSAYETMWSNCHILSKLLLVVSWSLFYRTVSRNGNVLFHK